MSMHLLQILQALAESGGDLSPAQDLMRKTLGILGSTEDAPGRFVRLARAFKDAAPEDQTAVLDWINDTMPAGK